MRHHEGIKKVPFMMKDGIINSPKPKIHSLYEKHPHQDYYVPQKSLSEKGSLIITYWLKVFHNGLKTSMTGLNLGITKWTQ